LKKTFGNDIQIKRRLDSVLRRLKTDPYLGKALRGELSGKWSLRIGDYRVIYTINEDERTVMLYHVKHRKTAYK